MSSDYWAAENIYAANELGYMTGIGGTDLFMPEANITRAQLAKVFANMAGHVDNGLHTPSKFDDVNAMSWYAECVAWASEAGIVTGYDDTTFGPEDNATREQVAVMLYRYAAAQGKDVTVADADATLAAYKTPTRSPTGPRTPWRGPSRTASSASTPTSCGPSRTSSAPLWPPSPSASSPRPCPRRKLPDGSHRLRIA